MPDDDLIRLARLAQHDAERALAQHGLTAGTRALLSAARITTEVVLDTGGYRVGDLHQPLHPQRSRALYPITSQET